MKRKTKAKSNETGITLVALVVTIIVLLILAGITIRLVLNDNGIIQRAKDSSEIWANASLNEEVMMGEFDNAISEYTDGNGGGSGGSGLSSEQVTAIINKIGETTTEPLTVSYSPKSTNTTVTIPATHNGAVSDQTFSQNDSSNGKKSLGVSGLTWYVLSADENGVNLVSSQTASEVVFKDADGYDNCLYYLNQIATNLFTNEDKGVTSDRVHMLNISDLKKAVKSVNNWTESDWETNFVNKASYISEKVSKVGDPVDYTSAKKYPRLYGTGANAVIANNPMYDETIGGEGIPISYDRINNSTAGSSLRVNGTFFEYRNDIAKQTTNLSTFGESGISKQLFNRDNTSGTNYWLATRCIAADFPGVCYILHCVYLGVITAEPLAYGEGWSSEDGHPCRVVVSIPGNYVNVAADGTVTIK